jgi:hypothetical protein
LTPRQEQAPEVWKRTTPRGPVQGLANGERPVEVRELAFGVGPGFGGGVAVSQQREQARPVLGVMTGQEPRPLTGRDLTAPTEARFALLCGRAVLDGIALGLNAKVVVHWVSFVSAAE